MSLIKRIHPDSSNLLIVEMHDEENLEMLLEIAKYTKVKVLKLVWLSLGLFLLGSSLIIILAVLDVKNETDSKNESDDASISILSFLNISIYSLTWATSASCFLFHGITDFYLTKKYQHLYNVDNTTTNDTRASATISLRGIAAIFLATGGGLELLSAILYESFSNSSSIVELMSYHFYVLEVLIEIYGRWTQKPNSSFSHSSKKKIFTYLSLLVLV